MPWNSRRATSKIGVGWQAADQKGAGPHDQHGQHQHGLAADAVAEMAEDHAAKWPRHEADGIGCEGRERADDWIETWEEQLVEHQRCRGAVDQEIVPLHRRADHAGPHDGAHPGGTDGNVGRSGGNCRHCRHLCFRYSAGTTQYSGMTQQICQHQQNETERPLRGSRAVAQISCGPISAVPSRVAHIRYQR